MKKIVIILLCLGIFLFLMKKEKQEIKNVGNNGQTVIAFGDSLSYGYGAGGQEKSYPSLLGQKINRSVINMGENGATAVGSLERLPEVLAQDPYMVLIEFGGNDFMRGVDFQQTLSAIEQMVDAVQSSGAVAVVVDTGGFYGMKKYSKEYQKIAKEKQAVFVEGILNDVFGKRGLMSDQIHPNAKGYEIVAEKVYQEIKDYL